MGMCNGKKGQCKAKVKLTIADEFVEEVNEHTYPHSETQVEVQKTIDLLKGSIQRQEIPASKY